MGQKDSYDKSPVSLALQEEFDLPWFCIELSPLMFTLLNYNGSIVYSTKLPEKVKEFNKNFFNFNKVKPFKFSIGTIELFDGCHDDVLERIVFRVNDVHGKYYFKEYCEA